MDDPSKGPIPPALSPEEWAEFLADPDSPQWRLPGLGPGEHATAAIALHGQPFGFTREDLAAIERIEDGDDAHEVMLRLLSLKARIEALLPPSDEKPPQEPNG